MDFSIVPVRGITPKSDKKRAAQLGSPLKPMSDRSQRSPAYIAAIAQEVSLWLMVAIGLLAWQHPKSPAIPRLQALVELLRSIRAM
jgi:hypothetical protein